MSVAIWYWLLFVICLVFGVGANWKIGRAAGWAGWSGLVPFILFFLLGLAVFGSPIKG